MTNVSVNLVLELLRAEVTTQKQPDTAVKKPIELLNGFLLPLADTVNQ